MKKPGPVTNTRKIETTRDDDVAMSDVDTLKTINKYGLTTDDLGNKEVSTNPNGNVKSNPRRDRRRDSDSNSARKGGNVIDGGGGLVTSGRKGHDSAPTRKKGGRGGSIGDSNRNLERKWANNLSRETSGRKDAEVGVLEPVEDSSSSGSFAADVEADKRGTEGRNITSNQLGGSNFRSTRYNGATSKTSIRSTRRRKKPKGSDKPVGEKEIDNFL